VLEAERAASAAPFWIGDRISHADIALACALRFSDEAHPGLVDRAALPALTQATAAMEATAVFQEIRQPFIAPT
jgi:glutathione S-transferase